jgi:hypothetical protein
MSAPCQNDIETVFFITLWISIGPGPHRRFRINDRYNGIKRQLGGVRIGADRDPSLQKVAADKSRLVADPGGVPVRC